MTGVTGVHDQAGGKSGQWQLRVQIGKTRLFLTQSYFYLEIILVFDRFLFTKTGQQIGGKLHLLACSEGYQTNL